ncbi:hypothetical protein [Exiguobacterium sp.]|nr:hypothetical protein [Exiguobacterium sp.]
MDVLGENWTEGVDAFFFSKEEMEKFYRQLEQEMTEILPPPFLL